MVLVGSKMENYVSGLYLMSFVLWKYAKLMIDSSNLTEHLSINNSKVVGNLINASSSWNPNRTQRINTWLASRRVAVNEINLTSGKRIRLGFILKRRKRNQNNMSKLSWNFDPPSDLPFPLSSCGNETLQGGQRKQSLEASTGFSTPSRQEKLDKA